MGTRERDLISLGTRGDFNELGPERGISFHWESGVTSMNGDQRDRRHLNANQGEVL